MQTLAGEDGEDGEDGEEGQTEEEASRAAVIAASQKEGGSMHVDDNYVPLENNPGPRYPPTHNGQDLDVLQYGEYPTDQGSHTSKRLRNQDTIVPVNLVQMSMCVPAPSLLGIVEGSRSWLTCVAQNCFGLRSWFISSSALLGAALSWMCTPASPRPAHSHHFQHGAWVLCITLASHFTPTSQSRCRGRCCSAKKMNKFGVMSAREPYRFPLMNLQDAGCVIDHEQGEHVARPE